MRSFIRDGSVYSITVGMWKIRTRKMESSLFRPEIPWVRKSKAKLAPKAS